MLPSEFARYVTQIQFRRALFGYRPADVHQHLHAVKGWFSLAGIEEPLQERLREVEAEADRRLRAADVEAARIVDEARREAEQIGRAARQEAHALFADARREAELERRGRSRIGRPVNGDRSGARLRLLGRVRSRSG